MSTYINLSQVDNMLISRAKALEFKTSAQRNLTQCCKRLVTVRPGLHLAYTHRRKVE